MELQHLKHLEAACVQEQPPRCLAACPLHVDARALCGHVAVSDWDAAWKVLQKTIPMPGLLCRVCDAPCEQACLRNAAGEAVRIGLIERAVVSHPAPLQRLLPLPGKGKYVAVAGSGLSSLTAAWDLARKGYAVTILEPGAGPGAALVARYPAALAADIVEAEIAALRKLQVTVRRAQPFDQDGFPDNLLEEFDAVYLGLDANLVMGFDLGRIAPILRTTAINRVLAGGDTVSPVWQAAHGRWAATSMDRMLQQVSIQANREKEGPFESRLFTSLKHVSSLPAVQPAAPGNGYTPEEAMREAQRCLKCECMECVKACTYLQEYKSYPKAYARRIHNNAAIVKGSRTANRLINSCMLCGQCTRICPNDFPMAALCLSAREGMVRIGKMPPSAFDFALEDLRFNLSSAFQLLRHAPHQGESRYLFFPGCQLCGSCPGHVYSAYDWLRKNLDEQTGLALGCCGAPALWAGERERFEAILRAVEQRIRKMGSPVLVVACATCNDIFKRYLPELDVTTLWEILAAGSVLFPVGVTGGPSKPLALHDPCSSRDYPLLQASVRSLLAALEQPVLELELGGERTACCGYGGLLYSANPGLARKVARARAAESDLDFVAYCAMCRDSLAAEGKRVWHLLDLIFPKSGACDPAGRPPPGFSIRQENKAAVQRTMIQTLWKEDAPPMEEFQRLKLLMTPDVERLLEERRILLDDVRRVIYHALETGLRLEDPDTGRCLAYHRPVRVTYWVEYEPGENGIRVHNAYSHRMRLPTDDGKEDR